ncbi:maleylpyruvate isomerase N-terminal domain-containing protein [Luteipulveratus flavus]|uniref:Maleylpyruvate isomerase family mycothiol-dependent enzyme n=1 Tax=Luteipulveratus flavus TaxID=3031728 RepID=A0ABT6C542_9MICO|nr:maleylpyruvate isomerase N-terminal domain-containing protein [Luteipulveratus sp. YIM 133296]MDF8264061.1 maleylpyruvate isomerase family mycothiol-dependent enzyme [Luteipulveratus sp. YIM 133296]
MTADLPDHPSAVATPEALERETGRLRDTVGRLTPDDLVGPSLCTGWSRGHVVSHLTANALGLADVVRSAVDGADTTMYASEAARDADIEAGAGRSPAEHLDRLTTASRELAGLLSRLTPAHDDATCERTPGGVTVLVRAVPFLRLREVAYHHVDLLHGFAFADLDDRTCAAFLGHELKGLAAADAPPDLVVAAEGYAPVRLEAGGVTVSGAAPALLGWLTRGLTDGVTSDAGDLPHRPEA